MVKEMAIGNLLTILFNKSHIMDEQNNPIIIYEDGELEVSATCRNFRQDRQEDSRIVERELPLHQHGLSMAALL